MTLPKHKNPTRWENRREALAPYNFVPLPEKVATVKLADLPSHAVFASDRLAGVIECELTTASPLYIRGSLTPEQSQQAHQTKDQPPFYSIDQANNPVIPGSSLRGLLRATVEIAAFGKVTLVTHEPLVYRAVGDTTSHGLAYRDRLMRDDGDLHYTPLMCGGYMTQQRGDWFIRPAVEIDGTTFAVIKIDEDLFHTFQRIEDCRNAYRTYIATGPCDYISVRGGFLHIRQARVVRANADPAPGLRSGTLACSGRMMSKRNEAVIYEADLQKDLLPLSDDQVQAYKDQLSQEQKKLLGEHGVLSNGQPVFYVLNEDGAVFFFGHTRMFRLPYPRSPYDYVPPALRREEQIDLAEAVFGYVKSKAVPDGKARAYAGRVRVSDAQLQPDQRDLWLAPQPLTPKILSGPKPTTFQHYLTQAQPDLIEVDRTRDNRPKYEVRLADYASPTPQATVVRGHKLYWHKGAVSAKTISDQPGAIKANDTQRTHIQPLRAGVKFTFRLDFDNLSPVELGALLWVLDVAADPQYRLSLGMGKPLGLGAVQITPRVQLIDRGRRYGPLFEADHWNSGRFVDDAVTSAARSAFEAFVLEQIGESPAGRLRNVDRIQALLALLSWPGPDPTYTRYLEIEHPDPVAKRGKRNEYDGRPVLPDPLNVGQTPEMRHPRIEHQPPEKASQPAARPVPAKKPAVPVTPLPEPPKTDEAISQAAKDLAALMRKRAVEREAEEERKRQLREAKKNKKK